MKLKLEENLPLGVQKELIRLFVEDTKQDNEVLRWVVPVALFVVTVLAQSLLDDLLYESMLKPFICRFIEMVCN